MASRDLGYIKKENDWNLKCFLSITLTKNAASFMISKVSWFLMSIWNDHIAWYVLKAVTSSAIVHSQTTVLAFSATVLVFILLPLPHHRRLRSRAHP